ncbi:MAG: hypothetical protein IT341_10675 [Chloroflexi bacterium]|nr:hypothetical protein [Chloroflexota bacterium]
MSARRRWPTSPKMPRLVDGQLTPTLLIEALAVLRDDGPEEPMTLDDVVLWLQTNVLRPRPPSPSKPLGTRGARRRGMYHAPAGRPGQRRLAPEAVAA